MYLHMSIPCIRYCVKYMKQKWGARWHSATSQKVAGSIPDGFIRFFIDIILPAALWPFELTQPLTEMSTRNIFWG